MKQGQEVKRGLLGRGGDSLNKSYLDNILREKFEAPKSELEKEKFLQTITPRDHVWNGKIRHFIQNKLEEALNTLDADGNTDAEGDAKAHAWAFWLSKMEMEKHDSEVKTQFFHGFNKWLMGMGETGVVQKTPWGRNQVKDKQVVTYISGFIDAKYAFLHGLQKLCARAMLGNLSGINEY